MKSLREKRFEQKKVEILKSAASAFRKKGFHGTSMDEISDRLLMTKGSLYYYFKNKEDLLYACHDYSLNRLLQTIGEIEKDGTSLEERLHRLIVNHVRHLIDELHASAMTIELNGLSPDLRTKLINKRDRYEREFRKIIQEGMEKGIFEKGDPKLVTFAIMGALNWIARWYSPEGVAKSERIGEVFSDFFIRGLLKKILSAESA
ncbi:TetR family transcriptional regulator [candidate division TA06 bacterium]|nr:TetR family transcriptional regulator [candidate division TA06 bacterium]